MDKHSSQRADRHEKDLASNWEGKDLDEEELDLEAQQTALDLLKQDLLRKKAARAESATARVRTSVVQEPRSARRGTASQTPVPQRDQLSPRTRNSDLRPIRQIPPDSYIGQTLNNIHCLGIGKRRSGNDPSSSDSSESSSESESSNSDSDNVRIGHVTGSSRVFLYDFGSYTIIQLAVVPHTSVVAIKCSCFSFSVS